MQQHSGCSLSLQVKPDKKSKVKPGFLGRVLPSFTRRQNTLPPQAGAALGWRGWGLPRAPPMSQSGAMSPLPPLEQQCGWWDGGGTTAGLCCRLLSAAADCRSHGKENQMLLPGGEGTVLGLLRPTQNVLSVFNEQGQVLHLHSASN